jgi:hypothetical protein
MALTIGWYGEEMTIKIRQGGSFGPYNATMVNPDNSSVDLTGCTITGQIRKHAQDTEVVMPFNFQITAPSTSGLYSFWLTDEQTATLECGENVSSSDSTYVYDIELHDAAGRVIPLYYGKVHVFREVTR